MHRKERKLKKDNALRFYHDVLGLERLHYGLWEDSDERTISGAKLAQKRYEDFLIAEIEQLIGGAPETTILDVGCGSGAMAQSLIRRGFSVDGLSPDPYQEILFRNRNVATFHLTGFQDFVPGTRYQIVLMSESAQYIPMEPLFSRARECMAPSAHLLICDYFTLDDANGLLARSGHRLTSFLEMACDSGLTLVKHMDITRQTLPTLDTAKLFIEHHIEPAVKILADKLRESRPKLLRLLLWVFRRRIAEAYHSLALLDSAECARNKRYMYLLFRG